MNLLMIVALKKIYDDNQAAARRRRRAYESSRKKNNAPKDHDHRYSSKEYSENNPSLNTRITKPLSCQELSRTETSLLVTLTAFPSQSLARIETYS